MAFTDEELDEERQRIEDLRAEIAQAEEVKAREVLDESNQVEGEMLKAERERLERQLAAINEVPAPVEAPDLDNASPPVVDPKAEPSTGQTPTAVSGGEATNVTVTNPSSLDTAKEALKNSAEATAAKAKTDKE
jgi:hypothetical protein